MLRCAEETLTSGVPRPFSRHRMVAAALTHTHRDRFGATWHLADPRWAATAESVSRVACADGKTMQLGDVQVLCERSRRRVLRVATRESEHPTVVAKLFALSSFHRRILHGAMGYNRYALGEATNLITAAQRGLPVPRVYGYGHTQGRWCLIQMDFLLMEDLASCVSAGQLLDRHAADRGACAEVMDRTIPIFVGLFRAGCNHIDVNPDAILFDCHDVTKAFVLDFEHAVFRPSPHMEILAFEAAYFAEGCRQWVDKDMIDRWFARLVEAIGVTDRAGVQRLTDRFRYYRNRVMSRRERRKIC